MSKNELDIPVFYGTFADLTKIDLSFINGKIVVYKGAKFRNFLKSIIANEAFSRSYRSVMSDDSQYAVMEDENVRRYAIIPVDVNKPLLEENWHHFYQLILSIYPSDFRLNQVVHFQLSGAEYNLSHKSLYKFNSTGDKYFDNFMYIHGSEYKFVRRYLQTYFYSSYKLKYVKYILTVFTNSFLETSPVYQYLSLIICLEVTVDGIEQLSYKLKRNTALLCGNSIGSCEKIYENVNQLYKLRSAIVHGNISPSYKNFQEYHDYLKALVARLIRELVVHNISTVEVLNKKLTALGYGQNNLISDSYYPFKYPLVDNIRLKYRAIQKY